MDFNLIQDWYNRLDVKYELIKQLYLREMALIVPNWVENPEIKKRSVRMLKVHNTQHFDFVLKALEFNQKKTPYNFYYSLAKYYNGIPDQDLNFIRRREQGLNDDWKLNHETQMSAYDFLIDIDADDHKNFIYAYESAKLIIDFFNETSCPFILRFSGKGFHIIIPDSYMPKLPLESFKDKTKYMFYSYIAHKLYERFSEMIDLSIYDSRRVCKLSYSIANYNKLSFVAYPFENLQEFKNFKLNEYLLDGFNKPVFKRGEHIFNKTNMPDEMFKKLGVDKWLTENQ